MIDHDNTDGQDNESRGQDEPVFTDGEDHYTWDEWFHPPEEGEDESPPVKKSKKGMKYTVIGVVIIALLTNVFQWWPQIFSLPAAEFVEVSRELSEREDIEQYKDGVVVIHAGDSKGTGFYIDEGDGYIITNDHVVRNNPYPVVTFKNGDSHQAEVVANEPETDIAVLSIDNVATEQYAFTLTDEIERDASAYIIGNPLFFNHIANQGEIIGTYETDQIDGEVLMIDAPIYQGSSGSPVINEDGDVFAVIYATVRTEIEGEEKRIGLAVSSSSFKKELFTGD
ncbi:S1 family peptidase [Salisediminibacterium halotolerans]|uniref:S1 family peptidase n=1 Tax=Salisediminibacterium halotolerans TaxID=517425 RepID=UPI000EACEB39|nr:serine protease [Salisediminibacterium halotolerans]RLJ77840.1 serine protease Do [Actinophytocola xinjiangensis]RPE82813.1 serine protease Do [Salisediminibacterium halotolerans]TWG36817.1 serine protease Do [Salisediminibacterium halotolerans]GEL08723.1 hypothetical protein SHA02_21390 [Salisediminibacterium halotolerans]